jgi:hypothetical protein
MVSIAAAAAWHPLAYIALRSRGAGSLLLRVRIDPRQIALGLLLWCVTLNAPLCCVIHCQLLPWLQQQFTAASTPRFVCAFDYHAHGESNAPATNPLPTVVQPVVLTTLLSLLPPAQSRGRVTRASASGLSALLMPTTPPPRCA